MQKCQQRIFKKNEFVRVPFNILSAARWSGGVGPTKVAGGWGSLERKFACRCQQRSFKNDEFGRVSSNILS